MTERPISDRAAYAARPTVRIDGREDARATELLIELEMIEHEGGLSALEARFANIVSTEDHAAEAAFEDDSTLRLGAQIEIYAGEESAPISVFSGKITALEAEFTRDGPPELVVLAEDLFQQGRMQRRTKLHEDKTLADLVRELAQSLDLRPQLEGLDTQIGDRMQLNESDLAFVRRVMRDYDADMQVVEDTLQAAPRGQVRRGVIELVMFGQLDRLRVLVDVAHQINEVTIAGWDPQAGQPVAASSRGANLGPGSGTTGADAVEAVFAERSEHIGHMQVISQTEAQAIADAHFDQRARRFVVVEGSAEGNPEIRVGTHLTLSEVSPRFDNTYYVVRAKHCFDVKQGYRTEFEAESAYYGGRA